MDLKEYSKIAIATCKNLPQKEHDMHMLLGMGTEIGELMDTYKKALAYGKEIDMINVKEELGDIFWYWSNFCTVNGIDPDEVLQMNANKLRARYPERFTSESALNRDLEKERKVMENVATGRAKQIMFELGYDDE